MMKDTSNKLAAINFGHHVINFKYFRQNLDYEHYITSQKNFYSMYYLALITIQHIFFIIVPLLGSCKLLISEKT